MLWMEALKNGCFEGFLKSLISYFVFWCLFYLEENKLVVYEE